MLQLRATRVLSASVVSAYYAMQPLCALAIGYLIILATPPPHLGLRTARLADLGGIGVVFGLGAIVHEELSMQRAKEEAGAAQKRLERKEAREQQTALLDSSDDGAPPRSLVSNSSLASLRELDDVTHVITVEPDEADEWRP